MTLITTAVTSSAVMISRDLMAFVTKAIYTTTRHVSASLSVLLVELIQPVMAIAKSNKMSSSMHETSLELTIYLLAVLFLVHSASISPDVAQTVTVSTKTHVVA